MLQWGLGRAHFKKACVNIAVRKILKQFVQKSCGISVFGDFQKPTGQYNHVEVDPAVTWCGSRWALGGPFQPQVFSDSKCLALGHKCYVL